MSDKPILFSAPMVRALLAGTKTQTRRAIKPQPTGLAPHHEPVVAEAREGNRWVFMANSDRSTAFATGDFRLRIAVGDRLWVRETWSGIHAFRDIKPKNREDMWTPEDGPMMRADLWYWADGDPEYGDWERPRPGIHMPRWASRITLTVTEVRVQRLQEISETDAWAEGVEATMRWGMPTPHDVTLDLLGSPRWFQPRGRDVYQSLWEAINGPGSWDANPWVAAYTFTVERANIDQAREAA